MRGAALIALIGVLTFFDQSEAAPDFGSGNYMLSHCQRYVANDRHDVWTGECGGTINTLLFLGNALPEGFKVCKPMGATRDQAGRIVVKYLQSNPEILHEPFAILAMQALSKAWPCK